MSPKTKTRDKPQARITRADIEAKFGELRGEVAVGVVVMTVVTAYWFGKRKGKKRQMVLEIRRI